MRIQTEFVVGPVGFEPTTSGPDVLGVTSAPGSPSITGLWYPLGGVNPLDQARRRPPSAESNRPAFLCYAQRSFDNGPWDRRRGLLRRANRERHDCLLNWITLFSPAFHPIKHLFHFETESGQFRGRFGGRVAEDAVTICHKHLVSG